MQAPALTLHPPPSTPLAPELAALVETARAPNTRRAYQSGWRDFAAYCEQAVQANGLPVRPLPAQPADVAGYLHNLAESGVKPSSMTVRLAAIAYAHKLAGQPDPTRHEAVRAVLAALRRTVGVAPVKKSPLTRDRLERLIAACPDSLAGLRDRALLLVGFAGAFRRSELASITVADLRAEPGRVVLTLRRSKTDQEAAGATLVLPALEDATLCPVRAMVAWLNAAHIQSGPLFRKVDRWGKVGKKCLSDHAIARLVQQACARAGLAAADFGGHSLRSGFVTQGALDHLPEYDIQQVSRHKSTTTLRGYIQSAGALQERAARMVLGEGER